MVNSEEKIKEMIRPLVTRIVENKLKSKDNELGTENLSSVITPEILHTSLKVEISEIVGTMKDFEEAIKNLAAMSGNITGNIKNMDLVEYKGYIDKIKKGNELIKNPELIESARLYLSIPIHENPPTIEEIKEEIKIDNITAINLYNIKLFAEKNGNIEVFKQSLPILNDLEKFVGKNVEDKEKYKEEILQLTQTQTQEGPSQGASSSRGDTSSEGATGSTSAEEETQTQEGPSQGASSSQGDTSSEGTTGSTSAEEETQTQEGPSQGASSSQGDTSSEGATGSTSAEEETQTQEGPSQGASSSQGDTSSEGATGSTSAEEETQTQEGPSQGASSSQGDTSSEGTTGSTSAEEETQTQNGPTSIAPSPEFRDKYRSTLHLINDKVNQLLDTENSIEIYLNFDNYQLTVDGNNQKIIELSKSTHVLEMTILNAQRTLINLELNEYKAHPFYYAKTDKELATKIENTNENLNKLNPKNNTEGKGVAAFYEDKVKRINEVVAEINSLDANDDRRKELEELIVAFKRIINHRLMREVHFNQNFQIKQFLEEQAQNKIKIDTINPQQIKQQSRQTSTSKVPNLKLFYEYLAKIIINSYVDAKKKNDDKNMDFVTFFTETIRKGFNTILESMPAIFKDNIEKGMDSNGEVEYYLKNSKRKSGLSDPITFKGFAEYFTNSYKNKKITTGYSYISLKPNITPTINRANAIIVNAVLSSATKSSTGDIEYQNVISEEITKVDNQQDKIDRKITIKDCLREKIKEQNLSLSYSSKRGTLIIENEYEYTIRQNIDEANTSAIQIIDAKGNTLYTINLDYNIGETKSKLHM